MRVDAVSGSFTHAHCFKCNYTAIFDKFEYRTNVIDMKNNEHVGIELLQIKIICPICRDEHCEGLFQHELN